MKRIPSPLTLPRLAVILAIGASATVALATPYATSLTNNAGVVSFRLNESNATVTVIGNLGTVTNNLGTMPFGLTVTNLNLSGGMTGGVFKVIVQKVGTGAPTLISDNNNQNNKFFSPRGVAVNRRPASPYFGRVYVGNALPGTTSTGTPNRTTGDGIYIMNADSSDALGQGDTVLTAGLDMITGSASMPWRLRVGKDDDMLYMCNFTDNLGNLFRADPNASAGSGTNMLQIFPGGYVGTGAGLPAGYTHGSFEEVYVTGSLATSDLTVYSVDEDYETTAGFLAELNSLWRYDIGNAGAGLSFPWSNAPNAKLATPSVGFTGQIMGLDRATNGYFYLLDQRSDGLQNCLQVIDPAGPTVIYESRPDSINNVGFPRDIFSNSVSVAVSQDMKYLAVLRAAGQVVVVPLVNGVPNLAGRFEFVGAGTSRAIDFDAADNIYLVSNATERMRVYSLGLTTTAITSSDGTFSLTTPSTQVSATLLDPSSTITNTLYEANASAFATFNIVRRNDDFSGPLTVNFTLGGDATRGTQVSGDYSVRTNGVVVTNATSVIIPTGSSNVLVDIVINSDVTPELTETIVFGLSGGAYNAVFPLGATISIVDDDTNAVDVSAVTFNTMFEGNTNDFVRYTLQRRGDTNAASFDVNLAYRGTATSNVDYTAVTSVTIDPGLVTKTFDVHPLDDALIEGPETVIVSVTNGTAYLVGTNNALTAGATGTIVDDEVPAETVLFSDNFTTDSSANWTLYYANTNVNLNPADYTAVFAFDYSAQGVPPAPHSSGDTLGLLMQVNKGGLFNAAGLNVYPNGRSFSNNFALRFDMYLMQNGGASTTEYSMCGINHDGAHTNWFRSSGAGVPAGWTFDGIWAYIEADGAALGDYVLNSAPGTGTVFGPTTLSSRLASTLTTTFHNPPWTSGSGAGAPGNTPTTATPSWAQVELSQIGRIITLKINNTVIMTYSNTTAFTKGNIMLGYDDAFDSVGGGGGGLVFFDNVRVVSLPGGIQITNIVKVGNNAQIDFTWFENDPASAFKLQTAANVGGPYADDANAATTYSINVPAASYRITTPATNTARFLRIRHQ